MSVRISERVFRWRGPRPRRRWPSGRSGRPARRRRRPRGSRGQGRRQALLLPPPQGLQVLRGQDRLRRLQGREAALGLRARAGQDPAPAHVRHLRRAPAQAHRRPEARAQHRAPSLRGRVAGSKVVSRGGRSVGGRAAPGAGLVPAPPRADPRPGVSGVVSAGGGQRPALRGRARPSRSSCPSPLVSPFPPRLQRLRGGLGERVSWPSLLAASLAGRGVLARPGAGLRCCSWPCPGCSSRRRMARGRGLRRGAPLGLAWRSPLVLGLGPVLRERHPHDSAPSSRSNTARPPSSWPSSRRAGGRAR